MCVVDCCQVVARMFLVVNTYVVTMLLLLVARSLLECS